MCAHWGALSPALSSISSTRYLATMRTMRTLLIIGAGDVARRALPELVRHWRVLALCRSSAAAAELRRQGVTPIRSDLDHPASLRRLAGLADDLLLTAPQETGRKDLRMRKLLSALARLQDTTALGLHQHQRRVRRRRWRLAERKRPPPSAQRPRLASAGRRDPAAPLRRRPRRSWCCARRAFTLTSACR